MGYLDGLIAASFGPSVEGKAAFYPYGPLGPGYALSEHNERRVRVFLKVYLSVCLPIAILSVLVFKLYAFLLVLVLFPVYAININRLLKGAHRTTEKLSLASATQRMATAMGRPTCLTLLALNIAMVVASAAALLLVPGGRWIGLFGTLFFATSLLHTAYLVKYSRPR